MIHSIKTFSVHISAYESPWRNSTLIIYYIQLYFLSTVLQAGQILNQTITFGPLDSEKAITFNITDDIIALEPPERFVLILDVVTISDGIMLLDDKTNITIIDDDGTYVFSLYLS